MDASKPLISIGMPAYSEQRHIAEAIASILAQDYKNFELIICDKASQDATARICAERAAQDGRIRFFPSKSHISSLQNFSRAFELARGEYFVWAGGHDLHHPTFLSRCLEPLLSDTTVVLSHPKAAWIDTEGKVLDAIPGFVDTRGLWQMSRLNVTLWGLITGFPIYGMIRSAALRQTRLAQFVVSPDITLLAELSLLGSFAQIHETLLFARHSTGQWSWKSYIEKHFPESPKDSRAQTLYWQMIRALLRGVSTHAINNRAKAVGVASVLLCMCTKYRYMLRGLVSSDDTT